MPVFKKSGGKIFGMTLNKKEQEFLEQEIQRQCADYNDKNAHEIDAILLWILHEDFGFGMKRLRKFYDAFFRELNALTERYEIDRKETVWLCTYRLKEYGLDIEEWNRQNKEVQKLEKQNRTS